MNADLMTPLCDHTVLIHSFDFVINRNIIKKDFFVSKPSKLRIQTVAVSYYQIPNYHLLYIVSKKCQCGLNETVCNT